jgi:hypothetical protein
MDADRRVAGMARAAFVLFCAWKRPRLIDAREFAP